MFGNKYKRKDWGRLNAEDLLDPAYDGCVGQSLPMDVGPHDVIRSWQYVGPSRLFRVWGGVAFLGMVTPTDEWVGPESVPDGLEWSGKLLRRDEPVPRPPVDDTRSPAEAVPVEEVAAQVHAALDCIGDHHDRGKLVACVDRMTALGIAAVPALAATLNDIPSCPIAAMPRREACVWGLSAVGEPGIEVLSQYLESSSINGELASSDLLTYATSGRPHADLVDVVLRRYYRRHPDALELQMTAIQMIQRLRDRQRAS